MNTMRDMAVRPSVYLSVSSGHAGVLAKRLNVSSKFLLLSDGQCTFLVSYELNSKHHKEIRLDSPLVLDKMYNSESLSLDKIYQNIIHFRDRGCIRILRPLCGYATET